MSIMHRLLRRVLAYAPADDAHTYASCKAFVDRYRGENNHDSRTNGELRLLRERLGSQQTVFDVGANDGRWAALALSINRELTLHCFEPSPVTFARLLQAGLPEGVRLNNFGLGARAETRDLYVFADGATTNSLYRRSGLEAGWGLAPQSKTERVRLETLDDYCSDHRIQSIDYLKIDVEGYELEVLAGSTGLLSRQAIALAQVEYGGCNIDARTLLKDLFDCASAHGYEMQKVFPGRLQRIERYDQRLENFQYQNWVLTPIRPAQAAG